jgi:hypothetical protein
MGVLLCIIVSLPVGVLVRYNSKQSKEKQKELYYWKEENRRLGAQGQTAIPQTRDRSCAALFACLWLPREGRLFPSAVSEKA